MNKSYRLIWNETTNTWTAVSELAKGRGKRASGAVIVAAASSLLVPFALAFAAPPPAPNALPGKGQVVAGSASIAQAGATMTIKQSTNSAVIDWQSFNLGSAAQLNFIQPSSSSATLNRVLGSDVSQIFGRINANGQVFLSNANGVYFGRSASVNVGALTATTHGIGNDDFMAGRYRFTQGGASGSVINEGSLSAGLNGYVALLAPEVRNNGVVVAQMGTVVLAAGDGFELQFGGHGDLANVRVTPAALSALVDNGNAVRAPGGLIILSAQAANRLQGGVVNNSGTLEASGLVDNGGVIRLEASDHISHSGSIRVDAASHGRGNGGTATLIADLSNHASGADIDGSIDARGGGLGGNGGFIETSAGRVQIGDKTLVSTAAPQGRAGTWLIDPTNFTIAAGTAARTASGIGASTLQTALAAGSVSIATSATSNGTDLGDINVNANLAWSANTLTLIAHHDININATMTAGGTSALSLLPGSGNVNVGIDASGAFKGRVDFAGRSGTGMLSINNAAYTVINSLGAAGSVTAADLQGMSGGLALNYALGGNIDATASSGWNACTTCNSGGAGSYGFQPIGALTGQFNGLGHTISNLTINRPASNAVGLFASGTISNVGLLGVSVKGANNVGGLTGGDGAIRNSYVSGTVSGATRVGGMVGGYGNIANSYSSATVSGVSYVGGLVSFARTITNSYATGNVTGTSIVGGLVGYGNYATITNSYATGNVSGTSSVGGLLGSGRTTVTYGSMRNSYATGLVSGSGGGLAGSGYFAAGSATNNFWDTTTSGKSTGMGASNVSGMTGMSTADMKTRANFDTATSANGSVNPAWDFTTAAKLWSVSPGVNGGYPALCVFNCLTPVYLRLTVTGNSVYGTAPSTFSYDYYTDPAGGVLVTDAAPTGTVVWTGAPASTSGAGSYSPTYTRGVTLGNANYALVAGNAVNWEVSKAHLTVTADDKSRVYGQANPTFSQSISGFVNGEGIGVLSGTASGSSAATASTGVGTASIVAGLGSLASNNYDFTTVNGTLTINKAHLTVTADDKSRLYGQANPTFSQSISGFVNGEGIGVLSGTASGSSAATASTGVGTASIVAGLGSLASNNYDFTTANGTLTINPLPPVPPVIAPPTLPSPTANTPAPLAPPASETPTVPTTVTPSAPEPAAPSTPEPAAPSVPVPVTPSAPVPAAPSTPAPVAAASKASAGPSGEAGISISVQRVASLNEGGIITVSVPKEMATAGSGFSFPLPQQVNSTGTDVNVTVQVTTVAGEALPAWLSFNPKTRIFAATAVPDGAFPMQVMVTVGGQSTTIVISARAGQ